MSAKVSEDLSSAKHEGIQGSHVPLLIVLISGSEKALGWEGLLCGDLGRRKG